MSMNELQKQTNANIQAKANLIWEIATHLVGLFKPHEYGKAEDLPEPCNILQTPRRVPSEKP